MERKFHGSESSTGAKVLSMVFSLPGTKVQRNEKAWNPASNVHVQLAAVEYLNISGLVIDFATSPVWTGNSFFAKKLVILCM